MSDTIYRYSLYIAGIKTPYISESVATRFGSLANMSIELPYSPYILHLHEQTKVQLWEQIIHDGITHDATLEFDGIVVGVIRNRDVLGNVSARLTCTTDGILWNRRKQYDFYLEQIADVDARLTGSAINIRADGVITNFFGEVLSKNKFDIGCAVASVLTSSTMGYYKGDIGATSTYYDYTYNGQKFYMNIVDDQSKSYSLLPPYYSKFLSEYKLGQKLYGIATSPKVKTFFQHDRFLKLVEGNVQDLVGENTFWNIGIQIMQYGFYSIYDIPNPTFIPGKNHNRSGVAGQNVKDDISKLTVSVPTDEREATLDGLAEYILKPVSVLGLPLECNIIWHDQVVGESLFYDTMAMPTRIIMQKHAIPGRTNSVVLTTKKIAGPNFLDDGSSFFSSLTMEGKAEVGAREVNTFSKYEEEYGVSYQQLQLSYAFDAALLEEKVKKSDAEGVKQTAEALTSQINNLLNYEFAQRFFACRNYSVQVAPNVNIVVGLPVIVMNKTGEHVVAFVTGVEKMSSVPNGQKNIQLSVSYPRFYYEDVGALGNVVDPASTEEQASKELAALFGSKPLVKAGSASALLAERIEELHSAYLRSSEDGRQKMRDTYRRTVCTYAQFMRLYGYMVADSKTLPETYLLKEYESSEVANKLSTHRFKVTDQKTRQTQWFEGSNHDIVKAHLEWTRSAQRV